jgi:hypothetical protein
MKTKWFPFLISLVLLLAVTACTSSGTSTTEAPSASTPVESVDGYPVEEFTSAYPLSDVQGREEFENSLLPAAPAPETSPEAGALTLRLLYMDGEHPVRGQLFFAADMIPVEGIDEAFIPAVSPMEDPAANSDSQGQLTMSLVPPGKYALSVMTPQGPVLVEDLETLETIVFDISAGELLDLGERVVNLLYESFEPWRE